MSDQNSSNNRQKPKFSAGRVTLVITLFWAIVFALTLWHGIEGVEQQKHSISQTR